MREEFFSRPIFRVREVAASIDYYRDKLGFASAWCAPEDEPIIAQVSRNGLEIILDARSAIPKASIPSVLSMTLHRPEELGALHGEFKRRGATITASPFEVVWEKGLYQLDVEDLDGNVLVFWGDGPKEGVAQR